MAQLSLLFSGRGTTVTDEGGDTPEGEEAGACTASMEAAVDEPIIMRENVHLGPFQTKIIE